MERSINLVRVDVEGTMVGLHWAEGVRLIIELKKVTNTQALALRFEGAGTSTPVEVAGDEADELLSVLGFWAQRGEDLPPGIEALRVALLQAKIDRDMPPAWAEPG